MSTSIRKIVPKFITILLSMLSATAAPAQTRSTQLEEVIVTAQKREQSLQDVGIAVTVFTNEQLNTFNFIDSMELANFTPGLFVSGSNGGQTQQPTIRGATQNDFADIAEAPNAVYIDEAYQAMGQAQLFSLYDMERVEVLKGPQGTLFGRNATGGLIHYITNKPSPEVGAYADITYGSYDSVRVEAMANGAISERVSARISGFYNEHDAIMENVFTPADLPPTPGALAAFGRGPLTPDLNTHADPWAAEAWSVRGQLLFTQTEDFEFLLKAQYARQEWPSAPLQVVPTVAFVDDTDGDGVENQVVETAYQSDLNTSCEMISVNTGNCVNSVFDADFDRIRPNATGDFFGDAPPDPNDLFVVSTDHVSKDADRMKQYGITGTLKWDLGFANLVSVSNYSNFKKRSSLDVGSGPVPILMTMSQAKFDWFTQELRLEGEHRRFRWIAGAYFLNIDGKYAAGLADTINGINPFGGVFFGPVFNGIDLFTGTPTANSFVESTLNARIETNSYSLFGQIDYDLTDTVTVNIGIRAIIEEKEFDYTNRLYVNERDSRPDGALFSGGTPLGFFFDPATPVEFLSPFSDDTSDFLWSGKVQLNWSPNPDLLIYAGVNRGVKAGSFNAPFFTALTPDQQRYDEEILLDYEAGFKHTFFDGRARFNLSGFYYDYTDYQAFQFVGTSGAVFNVDAVHKGLEAELYANPIYNLNLIFGVSYIDPKIKDLLIAPNTPRDVEPTFTPEVQFSAIGNYTWENSILGGDLILQIDGNFASSRFDTLNNFHTHKRDPFWIGNARVRWISPDKRWEVAGFVNNFSDTEYETIGFDISTITGSTEQGYGKPRWAGINARWNY